MDRPWQLCLGLSSRLSGLPASHVRYTLSRVGRDWGSLPRISGQRGQELPSFQPGAAPASTPGFSFLLSWTLIPPGKAHFPGWVAVLARQSRLGGPRDTRGPGPSAFSWTVVTGHRPHGGRKGVKWAHHQVTLVAGLTYARKAMTSSGWTAVDQDALYLYCHPQPSIPSTNCLVFCSVFWWENGKQFIKHLGWDLKTYQTNILTKQ